MATSGLLDQATEQLPEHGTTSRPITPMRAGSMGAALGLGVGLLFGEFVIGGAVIAAAAALGIAAMRLKNGKIAKA
jgi:hypothetical protein